MQKKMESELYGGEFPCEVEEDADVCCRDDTMQGGYE